jgi:hypothetical protein
MTTATSKTGTLELRDNGHNIFILKVHDIEGSEQIYLTLEQLEELKEFIAAYNVPTRN